MADVETLGQAFQAGWGIKLRCARGDHRGIVRIDPCQFKAALDMQTLVCTRGRDFPLARIASRLRCPNCGDMGVQVLFDIPGQAIPTFVPQVCQIACNCDPLFASNSDPLKVSA